MAEPVDTQTYTLTGEAPGRGLKGGQCSTSVANPMPAMSYEDPHASTAPSKARASAKGKATAKEPAQRGANSYSPRGDSSLAERAKSAAALRLLLQLPAGRGHAQPRGEVRRQPPGARRSNIMRR